MVAEGICSRRPAGPEVALIRPPTLGGLQYRYALDGIIHYFMDILCLSIGA
jgi:hypothetical protein